MSKLSGVQVLFQVIYCIGFDDHNSRTADVTAVEIWISKFLVSHDSYGIFDLKYILWKSTNYSISWLQFHMSAVHLPRVWFPFFILHAHCWDRSTEFQVIAIILNTGQSTESAILYMVQRLHSAVKDTQPPLTLTVIQVDECCLVRSSTDIGLSYTHSV